MSYYNFKKIQVVPTSSDFIDIVLSKTQRKTPTVVHKGYKISRIRNFYMRKVKFSQDSFNEKLDAILTDFPKLDDIHPFYADLMNVLYDKDHYKLALGQLNTARNLIDRVAKDYVRMLKFGDSLYRCKQLKKAALGRMATIMKRQKDTLAYLEQVRQHLARLPCIDPNARTILVCGYPNVGKSSFMNKLTRADVEVQPYAFTTKSLFVGHMDYKYLRWQVIDTPGVLDHPLEEMNTIEMQSITALAHLRACILYFVDLSEQCGFSIADQVKLFNSIKPLFANKPIILVVNKVDLVRPEEIRESDKALLQSILDQGIEMVTSSCMTDEGLMNVKMTACDKLLAERVEVKLKSQKINDVLNKLNVAMPKQRDDSARPCHIPDQFKHRVKYDANDPNRRLLERDLEVSNGGAGVYNLDLKKNYLLANDEWKYDVMPEIMDGKNVFDFIDPEIEAKLEALEKEEERLVEKGFYESDEEDMEDSEDERLRDTASLIRKRKKLIIDAHRREKNHNRSKVPKKTLLKVGGPRLLKKMSGQLNNLGIDSSDAEKRAGSVLSARRSRSVQRKSQESQLETETRMEEDMVNKMRRDRSVMGLKDEKTKQVVENIKRVSQRPANMVGKRGEADRHIATLRPKHMFSGKRKAGTNDRR